MAKKDKKKPKKEEVREPSETETHDEVVLFDTNLEPEEDVQFTDTSYTSASFESFQTDADIASTSESKFKKKGVKKASKQQSSQGVPASKPLIPDPEQEPKWSQDSLDAGPRTEDIKPEADEGDKKKKKKKKKEKEEKEEKIVFEKPKKWRKMDKNARNAWLLQRMEEYKLEKEMEKQDQLLGAKEKSIQLAKERNEQMKKDAADQNIRRDILAKTIVLFERSEKDRLEFEKEKEDWSQWIKYVRCDGLPNPYKVAELNTYIHLWQKDRECTVNDLEARCKDVLPIMDKLEEIQSSHLQISVTEMQNIAEIRKTLRSLLIEAIQCASYMILRNMHKNLKFESLTRATYAREFKTLLLNIWAAVKMPTKQKKKHHDPDPEPLELNFPNMKVGLVLPTTIDITCVCVRVALTLMDLRSEDCRTFNLVAEPPHVTEDLFTYNIRELEEICKLKVEQDQVREAFYKTTNEKIKDLEKVIKNNPYMKNEKEKEEIENLLMAEPPPLTDPRTLIGERNEILHKKYLRQCLGRVRYGEVHLRKYRICGGVLQVDLLATPPQPKPMKGEIFITTLYGVRHDCEKCNHVYSTWDQLLNVPSETRKLP